MTLVPVKTASPAVRSVSGLTWRQLVLPVPVDKARIRSGVRGPWPRWSGVVASGY